MLANSTNIGVFGNQARIYPVWARCWLARLAGNSWKGEFPHAFSRLSIMPCLWCLWIWEGHRVGTNQQKSLVDLLVWFQRKAKGLVVSQMPRASNVCTRTSMKSYWVCLFLTDAPNWWLSFWCPFKANQKGLPKKKDRPYLLFSVISHAEYYFQVLLVNLLYIGLRCFEARPPRGSEFWQTPRDPCIARGEEKYSMLCQRATPRKLYLAFCANIFIGAFCLDVRT